MPLLDALRSYKYQDPCNCKTFVFYYLVLVKCLDCSFGFLFSGGNENFCVLKSLRDHIELALRSSGYDLQIHRFRDNLNCNFPHSKFAYSFVF